MPIRFQELFTFTGKQKTPKFEAQTTRTKADMAQAELARAALAAQAPAAAPAVQRPVNLIALWRRKCIRRIQLNYIRQQHRQFRQDQQRIALQSRRRQPVRFLARLPAIERRRSFITDLRSKHRRFYSFHFGGNFSIFSMASKKTDQ